MVVVVVPWHEVSKAGVLVQLVGWINARFYESGIGF